MGTNYYCLIGDERLHIGKSSYGWCFALRIHPERGIRSLEDWKRVWESGKIVSEYQEVLSPERMLQIIVEREGKFNWEESEEDWERFHFWNRSLPGPRGLLRHQIDGGCIGHGEGTWDICVGDFS